MVPDISHEVPHKVINKVQEVINYKFISEENKRMIIHIFNHKYNDKYKNIETYGDTIVNLILFELIYEKNKYLDSYKLNELKQCIISNNIFIEFMKKYKLDELYINENHDTLQSKIFANIFEKIMAIVYIDMRYNLNMFRKYFKKNIKLEITDSINYVNRVYEYCKLYNINMNVEFKTKDKMHKCIIYINDVKYSSEYKYTKKKAKKYVSKIIYKKLCKN